MPHSLDVLSTLEPTVPAEQVERAESWSAAGVPAAQAARSASVVLVREVDSGLQAYLLHRHARMSFAPSMVVFPGGRLDPVDEAAVDPLLACACRETAEETGVVLDGDALLPWAHWITPEFEPRRFDTFFYLAVLPSGQEARDVSGETDRAGWTAPATAVAAARDSQIGLMPPTLSILTELVQAGDLAGVTAQATNRIIGTVRPELVRAADGWRFRYAQVDR